MTWLIHWLSIVSFIGLVACIIIRLSMKDEHQVITADEVRKTEEANQMRQQYA